MSFASRRGTSAGSSGPKPAIESFVKSHWFSAIPMKSRIAGSLVQARRSAARESDSGTPGLRKSRMSVPAVIESSEGQQQARGDAQQRGLRQDSARSLTACSLALGRGRLVLGQRLGVA